MKKKKLNLKRLHVNSFTTDTEQQAAANGGRFFYQLTVFPPCQFTDLCLATANCSDNCGPVSLVVTRCC